MSAIHREKSEAPEFDLLYGIHTVAEALNNPKRKFVAASCNEECGGALGG